MELMAVWVLQDSLGPVSRVVSAVLGSEHAVGQMLRAAAEANLSAATRTALREREHIQQVLDPGDPNIR